VTTAPGRHGRKYLRVRSQADSDHDAALAQLAQARAALHIAPLLHRAAAVSPGATRPAATTAREGEHWVQFGAYRSRTSADKLLVKLHKKSVQASVIERKYTSKKMLYLVRASGLADRAEAIKIAQQGAAALHSHDVLIGEKSPSPALHPRPPPR
jgi:cell division protein FtsN